MSARDCFSACQDTNAFFEQPVWKSHESRNVYQRLLRPFHPHEAYVEFNGYFCVLAIWLDRFQYIVKHSFVFSFYPDQFLSPRPDWATGRTSISQIYGPVDQYCCVTGFLPTRYFCYIWFSWVLRPFSSRGPWLALYLSRVPFKVWLWNVYWVCLICLYYNC